MVDLRDVKIVKKLVRTVDDTELMKDLLFDKKVRHAFGRHTRMENAKINLSYADLAEELSLGDGKILKTSSTKYMGKIKTVLVCGSNFLVLEEGERSMHDALCVVRCLVAKRFFVALCGESEL
ncbi:hypothetical protein KIW84_074434 [Lathyrus oleraceus]|uniref:Uncharacterized protein n=1 Tax=Pisum sativum TaxID=3888 RepID=A0A9D4VSA8_PEA|nr:hypothetical protein KIW84_074434 [Pisum sativum]